MKEQACAEWLPDGEPEERLMPYFQPIIALDSRRIMGYEALGRIRTSEDVRSLGPFFQDKTVPMAEHIRVDRQLRKRALENFAAGGEATSKAKLFINLKPSWIFHTYAETGELPTLRLMSQYGVQPERVVIEITEEAFMEPMERLRAVVDVYRREGCLIAIDDVGSGFSNMDRIAQLQPNLLKIDIHLLQKSERHSGYYAVLRSFSTLADQIGASLLVEGVETGQDLHRAIEIGARYVQGYLFAPAEPDFRAPESFAGLIDVGLEGRRIRMLQTERHWSVKAESLRLTVDKVWEACGNTAEGAEDMFIERLIGHLDEACIRVYLCREDGIQLSSNYRREDNGVWRRETEYRSLNWSWRPYFIPISVELEGRPRAMVSQTYTDLDSTIRIRTVSVRVCGRGILFIDLADEDREG